MLPLDVGTGEDMKGREAAFVVPTPVAITPGLFAISIYMHEIVKWMHTSRLYMYTY